MTNGLKWRIAVALLLVFVAGVTVGVFGTAHHVRRIMFQHGPGHFRGRMAEHLRRELGLTDQQFTQVQPIIQRFADQLDAIRDDTNRRVHTTIREAHDAIAPYLTPEQRTKLQEMAERHRRELHDAAPPP